VNTCSGIVHWRPRRSARRHGPAAAVAILALVSSVLSGCASTDDSGIATLNWYINPDNGGQSRLAEKCAQASNGAYDVDIQVLPNDASSQREQLVRRLAAEDPSIDVMSLDPPFIAEFANAGFLRPFDQSDEATFTEGVLAGRTPNCCGTASRSPRRPASTRPPRTSPGRR
jgi:multiple sugar transport system substrate-binding protein